MATRKPSPRNRSLRPEAEDLEARQLLSGVVSGTDIDGDTWTLRLIGPGSLTVTKQPESGGTTPASLTSATEINTITIGGTDPTKSVLEGTVKKGTSGNGIVYFQTLNELSNHSEHLANTAGTIPLGNGLLAINMPNFWLGNTTAVSSTATTLPAPPTIIVPDGVDTLRFGGVDTTHNQLNPPISTATSDRTDVILGSPLYGGTRILIDKSISSSQSVASTSGGSPTTIQHAVDFVVGGRLDLFQANEIDGDSNTPPGQFSDKNANATGFGGTFVVSGTAGIGPFFPTNNPQIQGSLTGQIGNIRIGGNATNFSTLVFDATGNNAGAHITNYSIGGETNNVLVIVPNGGQNFSFGKGMDTVDIASHVINSLKANRGAVNSTVQVDRTISNATFGGDVVDSQIITGVQQNYSNIIQTVTGSIPASSVFSTPTPPAPLPQPTNAQIGGGLIAEIAGNVKDSVITASVQPNTNPAPTAPDTGFGETGQIILPTGHIKAKIEGTIDNTNATPSSPNKAFYAQSVNLTNGPVIPPNVPEAPYPRPGQPTHLPGIPDINGTALPIPTLKPATTTTQSVPSGPAKAKGN